METPERLRMAAIPVLDLMELRDQDQAVTAPSVPGPGTQGAAGAVQAEAVGGPGEAEEVARGIMEEQAGEAMEAEARLEEGHLEGTKLTTTASRTLLRRHRLGKSSRHQELCRATTKTTTTG